MGYNDLGYTGFLQIDSLTSAGETITSANVDAMIASGVISLSQTELDTLKANQTIQSDNYVPGISGWKIDGEGAAEFSDIALYSNDENAIIIDYGSDISLKDGGDIKFTSVTAPTACTVTTIPTTGNVDAGLHVYKITYVNETGETELGASSVVTNDATHQQNSLTNIPISSSNSVIARKIYRSEAGSDYMHLLATISDNTTTTYIDNTADSSLPSADARYLENSTFGKIFFDNIESFGAGATNTFVGQNAGTGMTVGSSNTFLGKNSGRYVDTGGSNTLLGFNAGITLVSGYDNTYIGEYAGGDSTASGIIGNTFIGVHAGHRSTGDYNVMLGYYAGRNSGTGDNNILIGHTTGYSNSGDNNIFIGGEVAESNSGTGNVYIGHHSGYNSILGDSNVFLGVNSGYYETGSSKLFIDNTTRTNEADGRVKALVYGEFATSIADQLVRLNGILELTSIKSGATQAGAGAGANEVWKTIGHATLPDNVLMIGV